MKHFSLFSGIGGFDLAAQLAGFDNVAHCEIIESKRRILKEKFPKAISFGDIKEINGNQFKNSIDVISGGFPCQDISISNQSKKTNGAQGIKGQRSGLWSHYSRLVGEIRPKFIVFENSPMLLSRGFEHVLCDLSQLGYNVEWRLFFATQFGFPHLRSRIYGIAYSSEFRCEGHFKNGGILQKILPQRASRQKPISIPLKRFNSKSSYENVRMDDGFSKELDKEVIHGYGNAIIPEIALQIFKAIQEFKPCT